MTAVSLMVIGIAYLIGAISSAILVCRALRLPDPRRTGSGNPGATNVYRLGGRIPALFVLLFDVLKGTLPVYSAYFLGVTPVALGMIAIAACLGHMYPLYFNFKGGKGVATALGAILPLGPQIAGILIACWAVTVFIFGYSSLGALISLIIAPVITWFFKPVYTAPVAMLSILIIVRHKDNIRRLFTGKESKVWDKGKTNE